MLEEIITARGLRRLARRAGVAANTARAALDGGRYASAGKSAEVSADIRTRVEVAARELLAAWAAEPDLRLSAVGAGLTSDDLVLAGVGERATTRFLGGVPRALDPAEADTVRRLVRERRAR